VTHGLSGITCDSINSPTFGSRRLLEISTRIAGHRQEHAPRTSWEIPTETDTGLRGGHEISTAKSFSSGLSHGGELRTGSQRNSITNDGPHSTRPLWRGDDHPVITLQLAQSFFQSYSTISSINSDRQRYLYDFSPLGLQ
jgi:hypothetical protein